MKTGDAFAVAAKPIAIVSDYFLGTDLQNCGGCKRMQGNLNIGMSLGEALYDRFWPALERNQRSEIRKTNKICNSY